MQITVVGAGYVGLSLATLLGQKHEVIVLDIVKKRLRKLIPVFLPFRTYISKSFLPKEN